MLRNYMLCWITTHDKIRRMEFDSMDRVIAWLIHLETSDLIAPHINHDSIVLYALDTDDTYTRVYYKMLIA